MSPGVRALEQGTALLQQGDARRALPLLREAMAAFPDDARAAFRAGTAAFALREHAHAVEGFRAATEREPRWVEAWSNLAAALKQADREADAIQAARHALQLDQQRVDSWLALATLLSNRFDHDALQEGLRAISLVLRADPGSAQAHHVAGLLWRKQGDMSRAERHARQAVSRDPGNTNYVEALGEVLLGVDPRAAVEVYAQAWSRGLQGAAIQRQHGIALLQAGQAETAIETLKRAMRASPGDQRSIAHLAAALAASGQLDAAERLLGLQRNVHAVHLPTPAGFAGADAFHAALADDIRRHSQQRWEPAGLAARHAYLGGDLLADRTQAILGFEQRLRGAIDAFIASRVEDPDDAFLGNIPRQYRLHIWATQAAQSGFIDTHIHEESWLSGAYYVELPEAIHADDRGHAGWIEFGRPFRGLPQLPDAALRHVRPEVGTLLLFPSFLFHRTVPYTGPGERISISFDLAAA